jgi:two-component system sensor histidine kinase BaeS
VSLRFDGRSIGAAVERFQGQLLWLRVSAAGVGALIALVASLAVARWITSPLESLLAVMRARGAGDRKVRISRIRGVGVLRELEEGFNLTADQFDRADRLRRNLVADIAHELRTPVAVLQAGHEAMLDGILEPTPEHLGSLRDEVLRLGRMVDDVQSLAAAESATLQLKLVPRDLAAIAGEAAASLGDAFEVADVQFERGLSQVWVRCDRDRIREVVTNLLTNALKFTPAGGRVRLEAGPLKQRLARLVVSDTGIGIPPDELPRVTERFFRGNGSRAMAAGSGIGLAIVSELVDAHGGRLHITSVPGKGTTVTVTLPTANAGRPHKGELSHQRDPTCETAPDRRSRMRPPASSAGTARCSPSAPTGATPPLAGPRFPVPHASRSPCR